MQRRNKEIHVTLSLNLIQAIQHYVIKFDMRQVRERPFNLKGEGLWFFSKKNILIPIVAEKNILILVEEKKII